MNLLKKFYQIEEKEIADKIREYVRNQKADWQKIPWLALHADGKRGFSSDYQRAYESGIWKICGTYVDLESGEFIEIPLSHKPGEGYPLAKDWVVADLIVSEEEGLNAKSIVSKLEETANLSDPNYCGAFGFNNHSEWRASKYRIGFSPESYVRI